MKTNGCATRELSNSTSLSPQMKSIGAASREAKNMLDALELELATQPDIFRLTIEAMQRNEELSVESRHLLQKQYSKFVHNGLNLSDEQSRAHLREIRHRIS